jgi:hypothetical protein
MSEADLLLKQGIEQYHQGEFDSAIQLWQQARQKYQELKDRPKEAATLGN